MAQKKKIQNLLTWCLSSVEGNDEAILSRSFYGLANNKHQMEDVFLLLDGGSPIFEAYIERGERDGG
ncbi:unnamed protein product [Prunus brigantina]